MPKDKNLDNLLTFLNDSPTSWHAVDNVTKQLLSEGFSKIKENENWKLSPGKSYFVVRNGSLCAFQIPKKSPSKFRIVAVHTDSPGLKLKPNAEFTKDDMTFLGLEVYGGPLLSSWLNRDLGIAGRVVFTDKKGNLQKSLIKLEKCPVVIPQLAIHLDRQVNDKGLILDKQLHLAALASLSHEDNFLENLLKKELHFEKLLAHDLFLYPLEKASYIGYKNEMIASYRIDSLVSVHAATEALSHSKQASQDVINVVMLCDHEEIGSQTAHGADSPFFMHTLERITLALGMSREQYFQINSDSLCLSVDLAHAYLPNYSEKYEPQHQVFMGKGIAIKFNAQQKYASEASGAAEVANLCLRNNIPYQQFITRGDIPCGSTIGPIHASNSGITTVDIGCPQLSMHSSREITSTKDYLYMSSLLSSFFAS